MNTDSHKIFNLYSENASKDASLAPGDWVKITNPDSKLDKDKIGKILYQSKFNHLLYGISFPDQTNILFYRYEFEKIIPTELNNILDI